MLGMNDLLDDINEKTLMDSLITIEYNSKTTDLIVTYTVSDESSWCKLTKGKAEYFMNRTSSAREVNCIVNERHNQIVSMFQRVMKGEPITDSKYNCYHLGIEINGELIKKVNAK